MNLWGRIPQRYKTGVIFVVWIVLTSLILQRDVYGIEEGAARALLLVWSIVDQVVSPVVTLGVPDFRALFVAPVGALWSGHVLPAKISAVILMAVAAWSIYAWRRDAGDAESALLATGVLLISPLLIGQLNSLGNAPFLLLVFIFGAWMDRAYRQQPQVFGGWYFSQMVAVFIGTALHPAGLGYAAALAWKWHREPLDERQRKHYLAGVSVAVLCALLLTFGWRNAEWFVNPFISLSALLLTPAMTEDKDMLWFASSVATLALLWIIGRQWRALRQDFLGNTLLFGLIAGVLSADGAWATLAFTLILYWGFSWLLRVQIPALSGFVGQRGVAFIVLFLLCTAFFAEDRARYEAMKEGELAPRDALIESFVQDADEFKKTIVSEDAEHAGTEHAAPVVVASQWPGRTMLACRCDALPLPPVAADEQALLKMLHGVNYLMFDPQDKHNESLVSNLALLGGGYTEILAVQTSGVIVQLKTTEPALQGK